MSRMQLRSISHPHQAAIDRIAKGAAGDDYELRSLVHALVQSDLFGCK
ncbi:MAG: DUF1585 domain-containing protein [Gemmataceae bacterium]|nr:DUF1585 domain-containing protein [Gemmataceae bacterium]